MFDYFVNVIKKYCWYLGLANCFGDLLVQTDSKTTPSTCLKVDENGARTVSLEKKNQVL